MQQRETRMLHNTTLSCCTTVLNHDAPNSNRNNNTYKRLQSSVSPLENKPLLHNDIIVLSSYIS